MKNPTIIFGSRLCSLRRILTVLLVFAVVLVALPLQANAQEWSTTSTTAVDTVDSNEEDVEPTSEPVERPSAQHPDEYTDVPGLGEETIEPLDELEESLWPSEAPAPGEGHDPESGEVFGLDTFQGAISQLAQATGDYNPVPGPGVENFWAAKDRVPNPEIAQRCGLNIALVFDVSGSIGTTGLANSKETGRAVVEALGGTPGTKLGIFSFGTNASTLSPGYDMQSQTVQALDAINGLSIAAPAVAGTNWEGALEQVNNSPVNYDGVYIITDGVPTTNNDREPGGDVGSVPHNQDIAKAVDQANALKGKGSRLELLAVGMGSSRQVVLRDNVSYSRTFSVGGLGNYYSSGGRWHLNTRNPGFSWSVIGNYWQDNSWEIDQAIQRGSLVKSSTVTALAGADVSAHIRTGSSHVGRYVLPQYNLNQPTAQQIALSLTSDVTEVSDYTALKSALIKMLPTPCIANVVVEKSVVDQFGDEDDNASLEGWEFKFGQLPSGFSYQSGYQSMVTTDNTGRAEWRFDTSAPNDNGDVDITELINVNIDARLQEVVCVDKDDAEIPVEVNGQRFSIKMAAGQTYTCEVVNQIPGFEVSKRAAADQNPAVDGDQPVAGVRADGTFTAYYHIDVENLADSQNTLTKPVIDTLVYPQGFTANKVIFTLDGIRLTPALVDGSYQIPGSAFGRFNANETKSINVEVRGTANDAARESLGDGSYVGCEATGSTGTGGLLNAVSMEGDLDDTNNEACVDVTVLDVLLKLLKVDYNNVAQALAGAEFALYAAEDGQLGEKVTDFTIDGNDGSHETRISVGGEYFIVETKAPESYSLLPAPVHIRVDTAVDGSLDLVVLNPDEAFSAEPKESDDSKYVILQVADLQSGALPKSGGMGVVPFAVVALLILGLGALMLRRRM